MLSPAWLTSVAAAWILHGCCRLMSERLDFAAALATATCQAAHLLATTAKPGLARPRAAASTGGVERGRGCWSGRQCWRRHAGSGNLARAGADGVHGLPPPGSPLRLLLPPRWMLWPQGRWPDGRPAHLRHGARSDRPAPGAPARVVRSLLGADAQVAGCLKPLQAATKMGLRPARSQPPGCSRSCMAAIASSKPVSSMGCATTCRDVRSQAILSATTTAQTIGW